MARVEMVLKGGHAQVEDRYTGYYSDQHGRTYTCNMSRKSGGPADYPSPTNWTAPMSPQFLRGFFVPPSQYRMLRMPEGAPMSVDIDYDKWISDLNAGMAHFDQSKTDVINRQADGFEAIRLMENPPPSLMKIIGPAPFPPLEVVEEMADGDAWALGLSDVVPSWFTKAIEHQIIDTARATGLFQTWQLRELNKIERTHRKAAMSKAEQRQDAEALKDITAATKWPEFAKIGKAAGQTQEMVRENWKAHKSALDENFSGVR